MGEQMAGEARDGAVDERFAEADAGVVDDQARGVVVGAVDYEVVGGKNFGGIVVSEKFVVGDDVDCGVDAQHRAPSRFGFRRANVGSAVDYLALEVAERDCIGVDDADCPDAGGSEVECDGASESAGTDYDNPPATDSFLSGQINLAE